MTEIVKNTEIAGYRQNNRGHLVPEGSISEIDRLRDDLVAESLGKARALQEEMQEFKRRQMDDIATFCELSAERFGVRLGGQKGNVSLLSFNGLQKVVYQVQDRFAFNEGLMAAKSIIDELLHEWTEGASQNLKALINNAFDVDKEGNLSTARILALRKIDIRDERWLKAMDAIADALEVVMTTAYVRFYERADIEAPWSAVSLDLAKL